MWWNWIIQLKLSYTNDLITTSKEKIFYKALIASSMYQCIFRKKKLNSITPYQLSNSDESKFPICHSIQNREKQSFIIVIIFLYKTKNIFLIHKRYLTIILNIKSSNRINKLRYFIQILLFRIPLADVQKKYTTSGICIPPFEDCFLIYSILHEPSELWLLT